MGTMRRQWRVTYLRAHWRPDTVRKSRMFTSRSRLEKFVARLESLGPLSLLEVHVRDVGPWEDEQ